MSAAVWMTLFKFPARQVLRAVLEEAAGAGSLSAPRQGARRARRLPDLAPLDASVSGRALFVSGLSSHDPAASWQAVRAAGKVPAHEELPAAEALQSQAGNPSEEALASVCRRLRQVYVHRLRRYIGAYLVHLEGQVDGIIFSAGMGREQCAPARYRALERPAGDGGQLPLSSPQA